MGGACTSVKSKVVKSKQKDEEKKEQENDNKEKEKNDSKIVDLRIGKIPGVPKSQKGIDIQILLE